MASAVARRVRKRWGRLPLRKQPELVIFESIWHLTIKEPRT